MRELREESLAKSNERRMLPRALSKATMSIRLLVRTAASYSASRGLSSPGTGIDSRESQLSLGLYKAPKTQALLI